MSAEPRPRGAPIRSISAVLPAHNEAANLTQVIEGTLDALVDVAPSFELIVVDDGSTDATRRIAQELAASHPGVRVLHHARQLGYGSALREGVAAATKQYTFIMDSNRRYNPADLERLVTWNDTYDLVIGYRVRRYDSFQRRLIGSIYRLVARLALGLKYRDVNCGFKLIRTSLLKRMTLTSLGIAINAEVLFRAGQENASVREVGIRHYPRHSEHRVGSRLRVIFRAVRELFALRRAVTKEQRSAATEAKTRLEAEEAKARVAAEEARTRAEAEEARVHADAAAARALAEVEEATAHEGEGDVGTMVDAGGAGLHRDATVPMGDHPDGGRLSSAKDPMDQLADGA